MTRLLVVPALAALVALGHVASAGAAPRAPVPRAEAPGARVTRTQARAPVAPAEAPRAAVSASAWPPGTDLAPFELRGGILYARATLRSPSGRDVSGLLIVDTGAPGLAVTREVWNFLQLDSIEVHLSRSTLIRRPLDAVEIGAARVPGVEVQGVLADSLFGPGVLGLFGPSVLGKRILAVDYARRQLAIVNRSLTLVSGLDAAPAPGADLGQRARMSRSRARCAGFLSPAAVAVPFRLFEGGRILVEVRIEDPGEGWRSLPLTLLLDTGASHCVLFDDAVDSRVRRLPRWPRLEGVRVRTVLGDARSDATVLPRLVLSEAVPALSVARVETGTQDRQALPDIQGELPAPVHGLLGTSLLGRFRMILDYADEVVWLEPAVSAEAARSRRAQVGLTLERRWDALRVAEVAPGSPAAESGIQFGDLVVAIDGAQATRLDPGAAERLLEGTPGSAVVLNVKREGMERVLRLTRRLPP